jgi:hypothetical protein
VIFDQSRQCGLSILLHMTRRDFLFISAQSTVMGGENNNNNRAEDSLQFHDGIGTNVMVGKCGHRGGGGFVHTTITAHDYFLLFCLWRQKTTHWRVTLGGNPWQPRLP